MKHASIIVLCCSLISSLPVSGQTVPAPFGTHCGGPTTCDITPLSPVFSIGSGAVKMKARIVHNIYNNSGREPYLERSSSVVQWTFYDCQKHKIAWGYRSDGGDAEWGEAWDAENNQIAMWGAARNPSAWHQVMCR